MTGEARSPFQLPAEIALTAALANASTKQFCRPGKTDLGAAVVMPDLTTGKGDEENTRAMNEVMTDIEAKFDEIYLNNPRQKRMQLAIDRVRLHGIKVRNTGKPMRGLLVTGPTGSGKTTGVEEYVAHLMREGAYAKGRMPVLYLRLRKKVTVIKLLTSILIKFGDRYAGRRNEGELIEQVRNCIERAGVEVIVIDECQHLRNKSTDNLEVTDQIKTFLDDCISPVIFIGVTAAKDMFDENLQLAGRCAEPVELHPLSTDDDADVALLARFLELLDEQMVARQLTRQSSNLSHPYHVTCLHVASGGVIGQAYRIVRAALLIATSRGALFVETYDLSLAVERWAIKNQVCTANPFLRADLMASCHRDAA